MKHLGNVLTMIALALLGLGAQTAAAQEIATICRRPANTCSVVWYT